MFPTEMYLVKIISLLRPTTSNRSLRRGFLAEAVPIMLQGIGGPGAPHYFEFQKKLALGSLWVLVKRFESNFSD